MRIETALVLFNRDLRVHDHPALAAAAKAERTVPLFVFDERLLGSRFAAPNRVAFMLEALRDLDESLRKAGGRLFVRRGDPVREAIAVARECGAGAIHVSADWSAYARARETRLARACEEERIGFTAHPGVTVVPPGAVTPTGGDHFKVFTPYHRAWSELPWREELRLPSRLAVPSKLKAGRLPGLDSLLDGKPSPNRMAGGESEGRRLMRAWLRDGLASYEDGHDDLPGDRTSRLSAHIRWGCVSPLELAREATERRGGAAYARQLCWRDFHHQVLAATPSLPHRDYRPRRDRWSRSERALEAWREGRTGYPLVDAAMRQLREEGFMHNRARMTVASFLCKDLYVDWRAGAWHFWDLLSDGEIANNAGNWQWVAGTGNDTRPNRVLNPVRQAKRFDPGGHYVRRYLPELEGVRGMAIFEPWRMEGFDRLGYPPPLVDHDEAAAAFKAHRGA
ncbi:MAG TPA: deoxyribodipyrimidine photo-lyase [Solirubrobacterales bacterium]|jgi:deoxyribodipyrimidine photo-lyase|nr:deoxyribodipyrimidine photo-lyase [Solirubrobacterales bacterium]